MPQTRKLVRDAMRTALADEDDGFNARLAAIATDYGITPFEIDWDPDTSENFIESNLNAAAKELSHLQKINVAIYTSLSTQSRDEVSKMGGGFVVQLTAHLDFTLRFNPDFDSTGGVEAFERLTERIADAVDDAVITVLCDRRTSTGAPFWESPFHFKGDFACARDGVEQEEDGYSQRLPFTFIYEVEA